MTEIPECIREQLNAQPPQGCCVQHDTLPEVGTGYLEKARVATVGINPRAGASRALYPPMDAGGAELAWEDKRGYFEERKRWHRPYHGPLEKILNACGASFRNADYSHKAVSLDLVQWATDPLWAGVPIHAQDKLLDDGLPFFAEVLGINPNIQLLLGNGMTVVRELKRTDAQIDEVGPIEVPEYERSMRVFCGDVLGRRFIGWNLPLTRVGTKIMDALAERVAEAARGPCPPKQEEGHHGLDDA